jgi:hypothetical protein
LLATLKQRDFALLWFGGLISMMGYWTMFAALPFYAYEQTGTGHDKRAGTPSPGPRCP